MADAEGTLRSIELIADVCRAKGIERCAVRGDGTIELVMGALPAPAVEQPARRADESDDQHQARLVLEAKRARYRRMLRRVLTDAELEQMP